MWTIESADQQQAIAINSRGGKAVFDWYRVRREVSLRDQERVTALLAVRNCDQQEAGGIRRYQDTADVRKVVAEHLTHLAKYDVAIALQNLEGCALASCNMKESAYVLDGLTRASVEEPSPAE